MKFLLITDNAELRVVPEDPQKGTIGHAHELYHNHYDDDRVGIGIAPFSEGLTMWMSKQTLEPDSTLPVNVLATQLLGFLTGDSGVIAHGDVIVSGFFESFEHYHGLSDQQIVLMEKMLS